MAGVGAAVGTVSATVIVFVVTPVPLADTVIVVVPATALAPTASVSTLVVALAVIDAGLNVAVTPVGTPVAASATSPVNPPLRATVSVVVVLVPAVTVTALVFALRVITGVGGITTVPLSVELLQATALRAIALASKRRIEVIIEVIIEGGGERSLILT